MHFDLVTQQDVQEVERPRTLAVVAEDVPLHRIGRCQLARAIVELLLVGEQLAPILVGPTQRG